MMKSLLFLLLALTLFSLEIFAQGDYRPGYVILNSGDTLHGELEYRGDVFMGKNCRFRRAGSEVTGYNPWELKGFRFANSKVYVSREVQTASGSVHCFLTLLFDGKVSVLYIRTDKDQFFLEKDGAGLTELPYSEVDTYRDGKHFKSTSTTHIGLMRYYFQEAPELNREIERMVRPESDALIRIARKYDLKFNDNIRKTAQPILPARQFYLELLAGPAFLKGTNLSKSTTFIAGGHILVGLPRYNEKLFFRTGLIYTEADLLDRKQRYTKIPVAVDYMPTHNRVNFRASYGVNFYSSELALPPFANSSMVSITGGMSFRASNKILIVVAPEAEFSTKVLILPGRYVSTAIHGRVSLKM